MSLPDTREEEGRRKEKGWKIIPYIIQEGRWNAKTSFTSKYMSGVEKC